MSLETRLGKREKNRRKTLSAVNKAKEQGAKTLPDIVKKTGLKYGIVYEFLEPEERVQFTHKIIETRKAILNKAVTGEIKDIETLCKETGLKPQYLYEFAMREKIEVPFREMTPYPCWPRVDKMIGKKTLQEMGKKVKHSKEYMRWYKEGSGQHEKQKERTKNQPRRRFDKKAVRTEKERLYNIINANTTTSEFALRKARMLVNSYQNPKCMKADIKNVIGYLKEHEESLKLGQKKTKDELGEKHGFNAYTITPLLKRMDMRSMWQGTDKYTPNPETREIIRGFYKKRRAARKVAKKLNVNFCYVDQLYKTGDYHDSKAKAL